MSMESSVAQESAATTDRSIESDRLTRALTESMSVRDAGELQYLVGHDDAEYLVDVERGTCECDDYRYRGDRVVCKHAVRACVHHAFRSSPNTRLVARVLSRVSEDGCPHGVRGCAGPTTVGARGYPCTGCVAATNTGDWTVWKALVNHETPDEPEIVTDGGCETHRVWVADCLDCGWQRAVDGKDRAEELRNAHEGVEHAGSPSWHTVERRWEDVSDAGARPTRSEPADFGGGTSNEVEEL